MTILVANFVTNWNSIDTYLAEFKNKNQLIDLSDPEGPFRRQSATLVAYLVEHNEVQELEINDLERLDFGEWWFY